MSTGAMTGADAPALRALAGQLSQSATRLDSIRQGIRSRLYSVHWDGPDGADFRRMWDGQHVPLLAAVAEGLRDSAERLLAEADQQEAASGARGSASGAGGFGMGPATGGFVPAGSSDADDPLDPMQLLYKALSGVVGISTAFLESPLKRFGVEVAGYVRAGGTVVPGYWRWAAGRADDLNRFFSAGTLARHADDLKPLGRGLAVVGALFSAHDQWEEDAGEYEGGERVARAVGGGAMAAGVEWGTTWAATTLGASIGTAICPGLGTAIGGAVGFIGSTIVNEAFGDQITDAGAAIGSGLWNAGEAAVDFGGDVLEAGGDLLGDIGDGAADLWEDLTPW